MTSTRVSVRLCALLVGLVSLGLASSPLRAQGAGELRVGDRVVLFVQGERALTDSFTVVPGPAIELPVVGVVSLAGVRTSNLQPYLTKEIGKYFRDPIVRVKVRNQMRLAVMGAVGRPNYYQVSSEAALSDLLTLAGGPSPDAKIKSAYVDRAGKRLLEADSVQKVLASGASLTDAGLQSGDELVVPRGGSGMRTLQVIGAIVAIPASVYWLFIRK